VWGNISQTNKCPHACCASGDVDCRKSLDNTGYPIIAEDEFLLIFGGQAVRNKTFLNKKGVATNLYDYCETYVAL
jgi:hypothetical protein